MKGYTIQNSIELLEKAVESSGGGSGGGTAASVSYSNTSSGLVATNVQSAIDEIDSTVDSLTTTVGGLSTDVGTLKDGHIYSTTEKIIGKYLNGEDVAEITLTGTITPAQGAYNLSLGSYESLGCSKLIDARGILVNTDPSGGQSMLVPAYVNSSNAAGVYVSATTNDIKLYITGAYHEYEITLTYVKNSNRAKSTKKK